MPKELRPYQAAAIKSVFDWFINGNTGHPLVVAPVGAGKSLIIAEFIRQVHEQAPRTRIVVLAHVRELLEQNAEELIGQYQDADFGFYCAALNEKKLYNDITFASIQSINGKIAKFNRPPDILLIDECHLIPHNDNTQYRKFIESCVQANPDCKVIGFTGTPFRADSGRLDEGKDKLFDGVAYELPISYLIEHGYLVKPFTPTVKTHMDVTGVGTRGGDYIVGQLEQAIDKDYINAGCVDEIIENGVGRKKWLIFTAGVLHCEHVRDKLRERGISAEMITGNTPDAERDQIIADYRAGTFTALVNVAVLTTGFNVPDIDLLAFMRPTRSPVLYIQCIGRGIRTAPNKNDCMVLDFGGVISQLGPIDAVEVRRKFTGEKREGQTEALFKTCPACGENCAPQQKYCYACGYSFVTASLEQAAKGKALLTSEIAPEWRPVLFMSVHKHDKKETPSMRVIYGTDQGQISEFICFEHKGYAREKAVKWADDRAIQAPDTIDEAILINWPQPNEICVKKEGKYDCVIDYNFGEEPQAVKAYEDAEEIPF